MRTKGRKKRRRRRNQLESSYPTELTRGVNRRWVPLERLRRRRNSGSRNKQGRVHRPSEADQIELRVGPQLEIFGKASGKRFKDSASPSHLAEPKVKALVLANSVR
ncbi:integrase-type DNA-binding superfamily protein [Striga asiatica]|uniref:Integrase-type DNA-binding superfamily protein n=1 Tax=Striga asiatica TaxID=4170 RepID=A0A5A7R325_STRAF|nr:integrase-type DNA-binding superfamily protein [Striga asiatica]